jgi:hypothetical protein
MRCFALSDFKFIIPALVLFGCGGGGGGSQPPPIAGDQAFGGLWKGSWEETGTPCPPTESCEETAVMISADDGRFQVLLPELLIQVSGSVQVDGDSFTGTGLAYAGEFPDGSTVNALIISGTIIEGVSVQGTWEIAAGDSGVFSLEYNPLHLRDVSEQDLAGLWTPVNGAENPENTFQINSDGTFLREGTFCTSSGSVTLLQPGYNIFDWTGTVVSVDPMTPCPIAGSYSGLAWLDDSDESGGAPNDLLVALIGNDERSIPLFLAKNIPAQAFGGLWDGTWEETGTPCNPAEDICTEVALMISTDDGRFQLLLPELLIQASGNVTVDGNTFTGTGLAYADEFPDGSTVNPLTISGTINEGVSIDGTWEIAAGDSGVFNLDYDPDHLRGSSQQIVAGLWSQFDFNGNLLATFDIDSDGAFFRQAGLCLSSGTVTVVDPDYSTYEWNAEIVDNGSLVCPIAGIYSGLATVGDSEEPEGSPNDLLLFLISNPERALSGLLVRLP